MPSLIWERGLTHALVALVLAASAGVAQAADPVAVDPGHHMTEFETATFRVDRAKFGPGESSVEFFDAEAVVIVTLTPMHMRLHFPDGSQAEPPAIPAGAAIWAPAGNIKPENRLSTQVEFLVIYPRGASTRQGNDAVAEDPAHYALVFENERARVLRVKMGPKEKSVMHGHPDHVAVLLTPTKTLMTLPGGASFVAVNKAGAVVQGPAGEHMPQNLLDEVTEVVVIEPK